jgi:tRNA (mo5U34)-methyltransferase
VLAGPVVPLPTRLEAKALQRQLEAAGPWFYRFPFSNGVASTPVDPVAQAIHDARAELVFPTLDRLHGDRWDRATCIDLACHEGWFAAQLAARGAGRVLGIDLRGDHIARAEELSSCADLPNLGFAQNDLFTLDADELGTFDVTLLLGVLYHLENPVQACRIARSLTRGVCVIETQVARPTPDLECLWGSTGQSRSGPGIAVVRSDDVHAGAGHQVVLVPTLSALTDILYAVGFSSVSVAVAAPDAFAQFADGDRVVLFALA